MNQMALGFPTFWIYPSRNVIWKRNQETRQNGTYNWLIMSFSKEVIYKERGWTIKMVRKVTSINNMYKGKFPIWNRHPKIKLIMAPRFVRIALNKNILMNISLHKKASTLVSTLGLIAWSSIMSIDIKYICILGLINIATWHRLNEVQTSSV